MFQSNCLSRGLKTIGSNLSALEPNPTAVEWPRVNQHTDNPVDPQKATPFNRTETAIRHGVCETLLTGIPRSESLSLADTMLGNPTAPQRTAETASLDTPDTPLRHRLYC